mgnify:CR=1 FL=1
MLGASRTWTNLLVLAFSVGGMPFYGHHVYELSTVSEAFKSLFGIIMGTFDTAPIDDLKWGFVTIFFVWSFHGLFTVAPMK